ncbi:MAG: hypothetical protein K5925_01075, partial [Bacilli bacterium]|nr:hypothetical protein [Bacilli bacterium]
TYETEQNPVVVSYEASPDHLVVKLEVTAPTKLTYEINEVLDLTGMVVKTTDNYAEVATITEGYTVSDVDMSTKGTKEVTITHTASGLTQKFNVTVNDTLGDTKVAAKAELDAYKEADYSATNWATVQGYVSAGKTAIDEQTTVELVNSKLAEVKAQIAGVKTKAQEELDAYKELAKEDLRDFCDDENEEYYSTENWALIQGYITDGLAAIDAANSEDEVDNILNQQEAAILAVPTKAAEDLAAAKATAKAELEAHAAAKNEADYSETYWLLLQSYVTHGKENIDEADDIDTVNTILANMKDNIDSVPTKAQEAEQALNAAKLAAKNTMDAEVAKLNEADYSQTNWESIQTVLSGAKQTVDACTNTSDIDTVVNSFKTTIAGVKTKAQELDEAKSNAKAEIDAYIANKEADYSEANWTTITGLATSKKNAIDEATTVEAVNTLVSEFKSGVDAIKTKAQEAADALAQAKEAARTELNNYATAKGQSNYSEAKWTELQGYLAQGLESLDSDRCDSTEKIDRIVSAAKSLMDSVKTKPVEELDNAKSTALDALSNYYNDKDGSKYTQENIDKMVAAYDAGRNAIEAATSVEAVNTALTNAKAAIDAIPQNQPSSGGSAKSCGGSIAATSILLSTLALAGVGLLVFKKRKED